MPLSCVCGAPFNVQHAISCPKGGYIIGRHNEICDFTVEILKEICSDGRSEPSLQTLNGEILAYTSAITSNEARSDVLARGFWIRGQTAFADIRIFNPLPNCYRNQTLEASHRRNENEKKRFPCYLAKLDIKHAFTVRPEDWCLLGHSFKEQYFINTCLPFGSRSSPFFI